MIDTNHSIASFYDALASDYDVMTDMDARLVRERPFFHVFVERHSVRTAIDAGCGTGVHSILLAQLGVQVTAVDVSEAMIRVARSNATRAGVAFRTVVADLTELEAADLPGVDAVVCLGNTLAHVLTERKLVGVLRSFGQVLRPGGIAVVHVLNYDLIPQDRDVVLSTREREGVVAERSYHPEGALLSFRTSIRHSGEVQEGTVLHRPWRWPELTAAMTKAAFHGLDLYGGIDLRPFEPASSKDLFAVATRKKE
jgi:SAM-dependent methyltransferase